jgi:hypothetical protein
MQLLSMVVVEIVYVEESFEPTAIAVNDFVSF